MLAGLECVGGKLAKFMSLRGKGSTLEARKLLGSKFTLVFLKLQPRSYTLEDYSALAGAALLCRHIWQPPKASLVVHMREGGWQMCLHNSAAPTRGL